MKTVSEYWKAIRSKNKNYPETAFDFISIHKNENGFNLIAPLVIIYNQFDGDRPEWEYDKYPTLKIAQKAAYFIAALTEKELNKKIPVVYCN